MKAVRTDQELECPGIDAGLRARGVELITLPDGIPEATLCEAVADADLLLMCYTPVTARVIEAGAEIEGDREVRRGRRCHRHSGGDPARNPSRQRSLNTRKKRWQKATFALMIALAKRLPEISGAVQREGWIWPEQRWLGRDLAGATVGLVGCGKIGRSMARMAGQGFRARVLSYDPNVAAATMHAAGIEKADDLHKLLAVCDFVSLHCVLDDATRGLIGRAELACLKPSAVLINVSRGALIDEAALVEAVLAGQLGGVALDVFSLEPLKVAGHPISPLFGRDNVILFPHLTFFTQEAMQRLEDDTAGALFRDPRRPPRHHSLARSAPPCAERRRRPSADRRDRAPMPRASFGRTSTRWPKTPSRHVASAPSSGRRRNRCCGSRRRELEASWKRGRAARFQVPDAADADAGRRGLAHGLAAAEFQHEFRADPDLLHGGAQQAMRRRALFATEHRLAIELRDIDAGAACPGVVVGDDHNESVTP